MESTANKEVRIIQNEDRISGLPDDLIHKICSFLDDAIEAVRTSVLSRRWKLIWTTLPFLYFGKYFPPPPYPNDSATRYTMFINHVLSNRNHQSDVSKLKMYAGDKFSLCVIRKFIEYAISHNVQELDIGLYFNHKPFKLSTFSSKSLKKLNLMLVIEDPAMESDNWDLPSLTTLHFALPIFIGDYTLAVADVGHELPQSCLTCLPSLRRLCVDYWDISNLSLSLPDLTTFRLYGKLPGKVWVLPSLLTLHLNVRPQLLNLDIRASYYDLPGGNIMVSAPKLCSFSSVGIFPITFGLPELENVNIKLKYWSYDFSVGYRKEHYQRFTCMLSGLGIANNLSLDSQSIEVLSEISNFLASLSSPFYNLKCVKLPKSFKETSMSSPLRNYLLGGSPGATIVTSLH